MKEWPADELALFIEKWLLDNLDQEQLSDEDCALVAKNLAAALEAE